MSLVFMGEFEHFSQFPQSKKLGKNWWKKKGTLASTLRTNSERAARKNDDRAGMNYISEEGGFTIEPVQGDIWSWIVTIKSRPVNSNDLHNQDCEIE